ncbi:MULTISPECIES: hypothetical protein [Cyanophyceae]|uniref:hypothetical protein n=1 Tax=Cyanophyceae TaxID=3028117 RepID=UPI001687B8E9|nr:hypothetical protein [Trichocoleus sp. FACHB-40]MBD2007044.1 hypothetical protein [Trichocoleus sp. FACHB-40]
MGESISFNFKALPGIEFKVKRSRKSFVHRFLAPLSLVGILGCTGVTWLVSSALAPQIAQAYTARVDLRMVGQPNETYEGLIRRAEAVARAAAQRSFDRDILVTDVAVMIMGQNQGAIAPILALKVNRGAWRSRPDVSRWATYFPSTKALLGFRDDVIPDSQPAPAASPQQAPAAAPPAAPPTTITPGNVRDIPRPPAGGTPRNQAPGTAPAAAPGTGQTPGGAGAGGTPQNQAPGTAPAAAPGTGQAPGGTGANAPTLPSAPTLPGGNTNNPNPTENIPNPTENIPNPAQNLPNPATPAPARGTNGQR